MKSLQFTFDLQASFLSNDIQMPFEVLKLTSDSKTVETWDGFGSFHAVQNTRGFKLLMDLGQDQDHAIAWATIPKTPEKIDQTTEAVYKAMLDELRNQGYVHLVRAWNFIPRINEIENGEERYKTFCTGRRRAFDFFDFTSLDYPAATGVGTKVETASFVFLASKTRATPLSNPVQMEAYHYPKQYGTVSPSFARANIHGKSAYLSGTASIRNHETLFENDLDNQCRVTVENLKILCEKIEVAMTETQVFEQCQWRVYVREKKNHESVLHSLLKLGMNESQMIFLEADICRKDLLLEIEGVFHGV